jgi:ATP-dependent DNA ligase
MLARLESKLPRGAQWRYEPKLDGFRGLLWRRTETVVELLSRNTRDLSPWFPELVGAGRALPVDTLVDGEIVIADGHGRSDFTALQQRLTVARRAAAAAAVAHPAVLLVFDVLALSGIDLRDRPLVERRQVLERLITDLHPCLQLVSQTSDIAVAEEWLAVLPIEGVVAKRADGRYGPGRREWVKVKRQRTADCVVIGVTGDAARPSLVLGLRHPDGESGRWGRAVLLPRSSCVDGSLQRPVHVVDRAAQELRVEPHRAQVRAGRVQARVAEQQLQRLERIYVAIAFVAQSPRQRGEHEDRVCVAKAVEPRAYTGPTACYREALAQALPVDRLSLDRDPELRRGRRIDASAPQQRISPFADVAIGAIDNRLRYLERALSATLTNDLQRNERRIGDRVAVGDIG